MIPAPTRELYTTTKQATTHMDQVSALGPHTCPGIKVRRKAKDVLTQNDWSVHKHKCPVGQSLVMQRHTGDSTGKEREWKEKQREWSALSSAGVSRARRQQGISHSDRTGTEAVKPKSRSQARVLSYRLTSEKSQRWQNKSKRIKAEGQTVTWISSLSNWGHLETTPMAYQPEQESREPNHPAEQNLSLIKYLPQTKTYTNWACDREEGYKLYGHTHTQKNRQVPPILLCWWQIWESDLTFLSVSGIFG